MSDRRGPRPAAPRAEGPRGRSGSRPPGPRASPGGDRRSRLTLPEYEGAPSKWQRRNPVVTAVSPHPEGRLPVGLSQHPNQHRTERSVLLAVDQQLAEGPCRPFPQQDWIMPTRSKSGASGRGGVRRGSTTHPTTTNERTDKPRDWTDAGPGRSKRRRATRVRSRIGPLSSGFVQWGGQDSNPRHEG